MAKETAGGRPLLEGVRVLDLSMIWDGPYATRLLADLGAEVVKVEAVQRIDPLRHLPYSPGGKPGADPWNCSALFHDLGRNKLGLTLDLEQTQGKEHLLTLARISDVVVENLQRRRHGESGHRLPCPARGPARHHHVLHVGLRAHGALS